MEIQRPTETKTTDNPMLEQISEQQYQGLTEAFERIRRHGKDAELLRLLTAMHEAEELELCEERCHDGIRFWKARDTTHLEDRRRLLNPICDRVQWAMGELFLMGKLAFTVDKKVPPHRIVMTGLGTYSCKPELEPTSRQPAGFKHASRSCKARSFTSQGDLNRDNEEPFR